MQQFSLFLFRVNIAVKPGSPQFPEDFAKARPRSQSQADQVVAIGLGLDVSPADDKCFDSLFQEGQVKCANPERVQCRIGRAIKQLGHLAWRERLIKQRVDSV